MSTRRAAASSIASSQRLNAERSGCGGRRGALAACYQRDLADLYGSRLETPRPRDRAISARSQGTRGRRNRATSARRSGRRSGPEVVSIRRDCNRSGEWARDMPGSAAQCAKAQNDLGWRPQHLDPIAEIAGFGRIEPRHRLIRKRHANRAHIVSSDLTVTAWRSGHSRGCAVRHPPDLLPDTRVCLHSRAYELRLAAISAFHSAQYSQRKGGALIGLRGGSGRLRHIIVREIRPDMTRQTPASHTTKVGPGILELAAPVRRWRRRDR